MFLLCQPSFPIRHLFQTTLVEAILHLLGYVGAPLVREALLVAKETFAEMRAENPVTS